MLHRIAHFNSTYNIKPIMSLCRFFSPFFIKCHCEGRRTVHIETIVLTINSHLLPCCNHKQDMPSYYAIRKVLSTQILPLKWVVL